ncbi:hypothetical protein LCGC14_1703000 [marine sediment metagenome]|uniref:Phage portal protein n=1 Tax=marine sediment metagenome TaxID=412755 RepID=A0A0F9HHW8_9ZZZZ
MGRWRSFKEFVFGTKASQTASLIASPGSGGVIWTPRGYDNFAKETYLKNVTAFRSIDEIATSVASVPWKQFRRLDDQQREIVDNTILSETLKRPNPNESLEFVILMATAYLVMSGNTFFERVTPDSGPNKDEPKELYTKRPDRFKLKVNPHTGQLEQYIYTVQGRTTSWDVDPLTGHADVLHLKSFHPLDDWWGAAPTESAAREVDTSNAATEWNMNLLQNQGRPGMIYTLIGNMGDMVMDKLEKYIREEKSGPSNVGKDMIITGERGTKAEPYGWSPTDMDFSEGDLRMMRKIAMAYRVPPMLLGIPGEATFANFKEARLVTANESDFLTLDEKREMVGKDKYEPTDDPGSMIFIEASKIPIGVAVDEKGEEDIEEEEEEEEEETAKKLQEQGYTEEEIDDFLGYGEYKNIEPGEEKPFPNEHACRLKNPDQYNEIKRVNCFKKSAGKCLDYIFGIKDNKSEVQSMRYKKKTWTASDAKSHCKGKGGSFEAAG